VIVEFNVEGCVVGSAVKKILVVDDEKELANVTKRILELNGYEVQAAYGGHEGARIASEFNPDIIVSDVRMPEGSGMDLLKTVRLAKPKAPPHVVMITGYTDIAEAEFLTEGAAMVLLKPVRANRLVEIVSNLIQSTDTPST
jgi:DNA-binding NtrC family response regulator